MMYESEFRRRYILVLLRYSLPSPLISVVVTINRKPRYVGFLDAPYMNSHCMSPVETICSLILNKAPKYYVS